MKYDYLVIGAGVSGMTSAAVLATEGYRVALFEKSPRPAPLLRGFHRRGVYFDTGFHYAGGLAEGETFNLFLRYLGLADALQTVPFDPDGFDVVRRSGRNDFRYPIGPERLRNQLAREFPEEARSIDAYLAEVRQICKSLPYLDMETGFDGPGYLAGLDGPSLRQVLDRQTGNTELKRLLGVHSLLYGVSPDEVPFTLHAAIVGPYYQSVHGLKGGGGSLVTAFENRLGELGVDVFCGRGVSDILFSDAGALQGIRLDDGEVVEGIGCVATMHPARLLEMVPTGVFRPVYHRRLAGLEDTASAFVLYAVCEQRPEFLQGRNLFLLEGDGCLQEQTIYLTAAEASENEVGGFIAICATCSDATRQWAGSTSGRRPAGYHEFKRTTAAQLLQRIQAGCPELRGRVEVVETATPLTMRDYVHAPSGALYGVKHKVGQFNPMPQTRAENLLLAGQATAAPGVLGGMLSGFLACESIVGPDRLRHKVKACR